MQKWKGTQRRIGITGGIASGKSSVGEYLKKTKSLEILDADLYAKECLLPGQSATKAIISRFGKDITNGFINDEEINRKRLANILFNNKTEKEWLEKLIHPLVRQRLDEELKIHKSLPIIVLIIPLLFEVKLNEICTETWLIDCHEDIQLKRLLTRDGLSKQEAKKRIDAQLPMDIKRELADRIIKNNSNLEELYKKIDESL